MSDCRLYLITPSVIDDLAAFAKEFEAALAAGASQQPDVACVQLRLKGASDEDILAAAKTLLPIAHQYEAAFLLNDRPDLAKKAGADGVHVGQQDMDYKDARALLGDEATIGVTCHASTHLAMEAGEAGADYVAFGAFYTTTTKEVEHHAEPDILQFWAYATTVPCVAIGGITAENAGPLIAAGADFLAVSSAVWAHPDGAAAGVWAFAA
jgi:thiamine-phosphate pyrophosphorylase